MSKKNSEILTKCFCEARKTQSFFTKCLDLSLSNEDEDFLHELIIDSAIIANKIKGYCREKE